jgi:hypothetical protein
MVKRGIASCSYSTNRYDAHIHAVLSIENHCLGLCTIPSIDNDRIEQSRFQSYGEKSHVRSQ